MSNYTEHYNLKKPLKTENYDVDVANTNNDIIDEKIYNKVDKISGRGLSTNDFTNEYKKKIDRIIEGTKGDSAYQIAVKNGFEGTEKKWLESLKGDKGDKGELVDLVKEEEGKNISIESANLPAIEVSIEGESQQAASPSPDNLSEIENLEGENICPSLNTTRTINGVTFTKNKDGSYTLNGTAAAEVNYPINVNTTTNTRTVLLKANSKYRMLSSYESGKYATQVFYLKNNATTYSSSLIETVEETKAGMYIKVYKNAVLENVTIYPQITKGEEDKPYVPYNSLEIKDVGKNLYAGNEITINGTYSSNTSVDLGSRYLSEGTYTISLTNSLPNNSYIYLGASGSIATAIRDKATFTLTEEQNVPMRLIVKAGTYSNFKTKIMIEKGMVVTDYEPHQQQTEYFPLSEGQKLMEGSYLADNGIHHKRNQVVLDGSDNMDWYMDRISGTSTDYFYTRTVGITKENINSVICSHFKKGSESRQGFWATTVFCITMNRTVTGIISSDTMAQRITKFKTWLATQYANGTPVIVEYELAEEEIVPYTETQKEARKKIKNMILYKGTNHISCTGKFKIKYYTNEEMNEIYAKKEDLHEHANKSILDQTQEAFTTELKNKLDGLNNYVLPAPTSTTLGGVKAGSNITIDADGTINAQLGSSGETSANDYEVLSNKPQIAGITLQGNKSLADLGIQGIETGKGLSSNDYSTTEKAKLAGVEAQANKYIHPNTSGNKHIPSGGSSGQVLKWQSDGTAKWDSLSSSGELGTDNLNTKKISGIYAQSTATNFLKSRNYPFDHADGFPFFDILLEVKNAGMYIMQELHLSYKISVQGQEVISYFTYMRFSTNNGSTWSAWRGHEGTTTQ